jgi:hypothetical protein
MTEETNQDEAKAQRYLIRGEDLGVDSILALFEQVMGRKATPEELAELKDEWAKAESASE